MSEKGFDAIHDRHGGDERTALLCAYIAQHDALCPGCGYSLRGLTTGRCPECGRELRLTLKAGERAAGGLPAVFIAGLTGITATAVLAAVWTVRQAAINPAIALAAGVPGVIYCVVQIVRWSDRADEVARLPGYKIQERLAPYWLATIALFLWTAFGP